VGDTMTMNSETDAERLRQYIESDLHCPDCLHEMSLKMQTSLCREDAPMLLMWICNYCSGDNHAVIKRQISIAGCPTHPVDKRPVV
jgi:hypothetical protein